MYVPFGGFGGRCACGRGSMLFVVGAILVCAAMIAIALLYR